MKQKEFDKQIEQIRKEAFENGRIVGFEQGLMDELVENRIKRERAKVAEEILRYYDQIAADDGTWETTFREWIVKKFLGKQKPEGKKEGDG